MAPGGLVFPSCREMLLFLVGAELSPSVVARSMRPKTRAWLQPHSRRFRISVPRVIVLGGKRSGRLDALAKRSTEPPCYDNDIAVRHGVEMAIGMLWMEVAQRVKV
ncbi:hypothetical protein MRX96_018246 [Rhipicephalus microplus]